jgi:hypothetical protein
MIYDKFLIQKIEKLFIVIFFSIANYTFAQEDDYGTVEFEYTSNFGNTIYFTGSLWAGYGKFWIYEDGIKK